ncbi:hypothetical protein NH340_JMT08082 [Sarcoptes scabiei]|nr:hypothetical protein NH340_JMT08082 [Sarcoptes scabiei]
MSEEFNNEKKIDQDASDRDRNLIEAENRAKIADFQTIRTDETISEDLTPDSESMSLEVEFPKQQENAPNLDKIGGKNLELRLANLNLDSDSESESFMKYRKQSFGTFKTTSFEQNFETDTETRKEVVKWSSDSSDSGDNNSLLVRVRRTTDDQDDLTTSSSAQSSGDPGRTFLEKINLSLQKHVDISMDSPVQNLGWKKLITRKLRLHRRNRRGLFSSLSSRSVNSGQVFRHASRSRNPIISPVSSMSVDRSSDFSVNIFKRSRSVSRRRSKTIKLKKCKNCRRRKQIVGQQKKRFDDDSTDHETEESD